MYPPNPLTKVIYKAQNCLRRPPIDYNKGFII